MTTQAEQTQDTEFTTEQQDVPTQPTAEQDAAVQQEADASFAAGFGRVRGTPVVPTKEDASTEPPDATTTEEAPALAADAEQPVLAGLKESEIKALLGQVGELRDSKDKVEKQLRQVFGKFGDIQQQLTTANAGLGRREIKAESLKRLQAEYPDIAEALAGDLGDLGQLLFGTPSAGASVTQEHVSTHVNKVVLERESELLQKVNEEMLSHFHRDWKSIRDSQDLSLWLSTQQTDYRAEFLESQSATFISEGLDKFKNWKQQGQGTRQQNTSRLERAIAPKGRSAPGASAVSDQAAFNRGFMRVRGG